MKRRLLTERDVLRLSSEGVRQLVESEFALTPLARDRAAALGIAVVGHSAVARTPAGRRNPTPAAAAPPVATPAPAALHLALGADHGGLALKTAIVTHLRGLGHHVTDVGTNDTTAVDYPDFAVAVARLVAAGQARFGIMVDGAGIGSCMAANKVVGIRAAMCHDITTAQNAREHNNANLLTLGGGLLGERLALQVVSAFLATPFGGGRHQGRVDKIDALDHEG